MNAVLFDIDNTLLMKIPCVAEKWKSVLQQYEIERSSDDTQRAFAECEMWVGRQMQHENETGIRLSNELFADGVMSCCVKALRISDEYKTILADVWAGKYKMQYETADGAVEVLDVLRASGIKLGIVSNNRSSIRDELSRTGLASYFDVIVISEEVDLYKPDPRILLHACQKLGVRCGETIYVGDHPYDVLCAHAAGISAAWIPVNSFMRLPEGIVETEYRLTTLLDLLKCI